MRLGVNEDDGVCRLYEVLQRGVVVVAGGLFDGDGLQMRGYLHQGRGEG